MWKPTKNPKIEELTKAHKERAYRLSDLETPVDNGSKLCIWCLDPLVGKRQKWCSEDCVAYALAWGRPQTAHGLIILLERHSNSCSECGLSYSEYLSNAYEKVKKWKWVGKTSFTERYMRAFKRMVPKEIRPEVDHIIPVFKGGQAIGLENVRLVCAPCHKAKTVRDNKARFEQLGSPLKGKPKSEAAKIAMSVSRKGKDTEARKRARKERLYPKLLIPLIATEIKTGKVLEFESIRAAAAALGLQEYNISRVLRGSQGRKQHKGWKFEKKPLP